MAEIECSFEINIEPTDIMSQCNKKVTQVFYSRGVCKRTFDLSLSIANKKEVLKLSWAGQGLLDDLVI